MEKLSREDAKTRRKKRRAPRVFAPSSALQRMGLGRRRNGHAKTRTEAEYDDYHLPRAERVAVESLASIRFKPTETVVLVSGDARVIKRQIYVLRGGMRGWIDDVLNP